MLCMGGFEVTVIFRDEVRDPDRTIPRATYAFVVVIGLAYAVSTWAIIQAFGAGRAVEVSAADPTGAFNSTVETYLGTTAIDIVTTLLCTSIFAAVLATHNVLARYLFNLGVDGILPRRLGSVHAREGSPHVASVVSSVVAFAGLVVLVAAAADPALLYAQLIGAFGYALLMLLVLCSLAVMIFLSRVRPAGTTVWHRLIAPLLATTGLVVTIWLATTNIGLLVTAGNAVVISMFVALYGAVVVGVVTAAVLRRRRPDVYHRIGRQ
jgi:amino acid transporter